MTNETSKQYNGRKGKTYTHGNDTNALMIPFGVRNAFISEDFLVQKFKATTENAGTMPCFKINIITHTTRTLTIAKWGGLKDGIQEWQIWLDTFDLCRIQYIEQLLSLIKGLNARIRN